MSRLWTSIVAGMAGISAAETKVSKRGFAVKDPSVVERLESIGSSFVWGYNRALRSEGVDGLANDLAQQPAADAGFAYEGAAMGLAVRDWLTPRSKLLHEFIKGPAQHHEYMAWVGAGWSFARLPISPLRSLERAHGLTRWLALDGYGFHEGFFRWRETISRHRQPRSLGDEALKVFDQGLGRSLWFVKGADPPSVAVQIDSFELHRRRDLWSGVGLAAAYAGGLPDSRFRELGQLAGPHFQALAQGIVFAAEARRRAGNPAPHTDAICTDLLGMRSDVAADLAIARRPTGSSLADYRAWREAVQSNFANSAERLAA